MGFDFKKVISAVAPMLGTALGGPLGGAAASEMVKKLGLDKVDPNDPAAVAAAITPMLNDPEVLLKLKEADNEFTETMRKLDIGNIEAMAALDNEDRKDARARERDVKDYTPEVGFYLLCVVFGFVLRWLMKYPVPTDNKAIIYSAIGTLGTLVVMAATYFYGSNSGSARTKELLAQAPSIVSKK